MMSVEMFLESIDPSLHEFVHDVFRNIGKLSWANLVDFEVAVHGYLKAMTHAAISADDHRLADKVLVLSDTVRTHIISAYLFAKSLRGGWAA